jgi:hypothetical protein
MGDMIFMTPRGIAVFYPEWTLNRMVMLNHTVACHIPGCNVGCIKNDNYKVYPTTVFLQDPCGELCLALWQKIADGGKWSLVLKWDLRYPIRPSMACSHTMWQLAEHCGNPMCAFNPMTNVQLICLPPFMAVTDYMSTCE